MSDKKFKGMFIVFEGPDGVGKTTQIKAVAEQLRSIGWGVITTREPGGSEFGESVRDLIFKSEISKRTETLLFAAARSDHLEKTIKPAVEQGTIVLCDRYTMSSLVYQGFEGGEISLVNQLTDRFNMDIKPNITFVLTTSAEECVSRKNKLSSEEHNRLDPKSIEQQLRRNDQYKKLSTDWFAEKCGFGKLIQIDASGDIDEITCQIANEITLFDSEYNNFNTRRVFISTSGNTEDIGRGNKITTSVVSN